MKWLRCASNGNANIIASITGLSIMQSIAPYLTICNNSIVSYNNGTCCCERHTLNANRHWRTPWLFSAETPIQCLSRCAETLLHPQPVKIPALACPVWKAVYPGQAGSPTSCDHGRPGAALDVIELASIGPRRRRPAHHFLGGHSPGTSWRKPVTTEDAVFEYLRRKDFAAAHLAAIDESALREEVTKAAAEERQRITQPHEAAIARAVDIQGQDEYMALRSRSSADA